MSETSASIFDRVSFDALRRFAPKKSDAELCDLCSLALGAVHPHLIEPALRRIVCACDACAILFGNHVAGRYKTIPRGGKRLIDFQMTDAQWDALAIPIGLAFFFKESRVSSPSVSTFGEVALPHGRASETALAAFYPSPAGATESLLDLTAWNGLVATNPLLSDLQADVEALLVNRIRATPEYYVAPIDECYRLVGLIRGNWRGLSGGAEVWKLIEGFFEELGSKCSF